MTDREIRFSLIVRTAEFPMKNQIVMLLAFILCACQPYLTYEELEAEAILTGDPTKINEREARIDAANQHFEAKAACLVGKQVWYCPRGAQFQTRRSQTLADRKLIRAHRKEAFAGCYCASNAQMRDLMRAIERQRQY